MNKTLISAVLIASSAHASAIDLDSPSSTPVNFASETVAPSGGADTTVSETITNTLGFGITDNSSRFLRYDLPGTKFIALPTLLIPGQTGAGIVYVSGGVGKDNIIYEVIADGSTSIAPTDSATLTFAMTSPNLTLEGETVEVTYGNYFTAPGALTRNPLDQLATSSGTLFTFAPGTGVAALSNGTAPLQIDFASSDTRFVGNSTRSAIGSFYAAEVPGDQFLLDGVTDITIAGSRTGASRLVVSGDFTATADDSTGTYVPSRVYLSNDACTTSILDASTVSADEAVIPVGNTSYGTIASPAALSSGPDICMQVNGVTPIAEANYTAVYVPIAASGFNLAEVPLTLGSLVKNSANATSNLILTPTSIGGQFNGFVRVTNTSGTGGNVYFRLINDLGEAGPSVLLGDVLNSSSSRLNAGASTRDIDISEIYAASVDADPSWSIASDELNKLRLITTGDFATIDVTLITISLDETTIGTF